MENAHLVAIESALVAVQRLGTGATLVFLHAGVGDQRMWQPQIDVLSTSFETIAYDRRGFGQTTTPDEPFSHVDDLRTLLQKLDRPSVSLIGSSQGARIAIDYALTFPESVRSLALLSPALSGADSPDSFPPEIQASLDELDRADEADDLDRINRAEAHLWLDGPAAPEGRVSGPIRDLFLDMNAIALNHPDLDREREPKSAVERLHSIAVPTLVIYGQLDFPHVKERAVTIASSIPGAESKEIPESAHLCNLERPELVNALLCKFLPSSITRTSVRK